MQIHELATLSGNPAAGTYMAVDNGSTTRKLDYAALAKAIVEQYGGSTIAGSAQTLQAAINGLNTSIGNALDGAEVRKIFNGAMVTAHDSGAGDLGGFVLYGKTTQDGTPAPDAAKEISYVGSDGSVTITSSNKNLALPVAAGTQKPSGVSFVSNGMGLVIANGTASGDESISSPSIALAAGTYILSGCPSGGSNATYNCYPWDITTNSRPTGLTVNDNDTGNGVSFVAEAGHTYAMTMRVRSGVAANNLAFRIMVRPASITDAAFVENASASATIAVTNGLHGITVASGGNYVDTSGQHWICDTIDVDSGKYIQRVLHYTIPESATTSIIGTIVARTNTVRTTINIGLPSSPTNAYTNANMTSNVLPYSSTMWNNDVLGINLTSESRLAISIPISAGTTSADILTWLKNNNFEAVVPLPAPIITDLTTEQKTALAALKSFDGVTSVYTDDAVAPELRAKIFVDAGAYM